MTNRRTKQTRTYNFSRKWNGWWQMTRRFNISVLGSYTANEPESALAYKLGAGLAEMNVNVISGGQEGVMLNLAKGVAEARKNTPASSYLVGILARMDVGDANEYLDLTIPTGAPHLQKSLVPLAGDLVIAIGGAAGTLTELTFAWEFNKPIALLGSDGWAGILADSRLDHRRDDRLKHFTRVEDVLAWARDELAIKKSEQ
jgi:uncharacterized protein (TIGR00725 family)